MLVCDLLSIQSLEGHIGAVVVLSGKGFTLLLGVEVGALGS
jgi:hypothetical protein